MVRLPCPVLRPPALQGRTRCKHYARLASPVQRYGHMYFHFMQEVLPRVILMRSLLKADPSIKLLMFGAPYEYEWLSALGIPKEQVRHVSSAQPHTCAQTPLSCIFLAPPITPCALPSTGRAIRSIAVLLRRFAHRPCCFAFHDAAQGELHHRELPGLPCQGVGCCIAGTVGTLVGSFPVLLCLCTPWDG